MKSAQLISPTLYMFNKVPLSERGKCTNESYLISLSGDFLVYSAFQKPYGWLGNESFCRLSACQLSVLSKIEGGPN